MKWFIFLFIFLNTLPAVANAGISANKNSKFEATWKAFNENADNKGEEIKWVIFGPIAKILGIIATGYGVCMLMMGQTRPIMITIGVGILLAILPNFIESVFGAMLAV